MSGQSELPKVHQFPVSMPPPPIADSTEPLSRSTTIERWLPWALAAGALFTLFYQLGGPGLFEPDEGRNAEKAREILLLNDWVTPHNNFYPVLDKPIFLYWLIALSYQLFGVSEWAARLPSALAALASLAIVYDFTRRHWGQREALWSVTILLSSAEFFIFARVVIFDALLTLCVTLALAMFFAAIHATESRWRFICCVILYAALGVGTLLKGLVGLVLPGMVFFFYLLATRRWAALKKIHLIPGILLYLAIVLPWYLQAETHNSGFLRYYLWDEHFGRYATAKFERGQPWYYFIFVLAVGFLPWTTVIPAIVKAAWQKSLDDKTLFLFLWTGLPLLFFSISSAKLPQYILPMFPPLAILAGVTVTRMFAEYDRRVRTLISIVWWIQGVSIFYFFVGWLEPVVLPRALRAGIGEIGWFLQVAAPVWLLFLTLSVTTRSANFWSAADKVFGINVGLMVLFAAFLVQAALTATPDRSAKGVGAALQPHLRPAAQVVSYDTYIEGLPFYLRTEKPLWLVTHENKKKTFRGNFHTIGGSTAAGSKWGETVLNFDQFKQILESSDQPLLIVVKEKNFAQLKPQLGPAAKKLGTVDEYVLIAQP